MTGGDLIPSSGSQAAKRVRETRSAGWRDLVADLLIGFDFDFPPSEDFSGRALAMSFAELQIVEIEASLHAGHRTAEMIDDGEPPYYLMALQQSGRFRVVQDGRTAVLTPGQFVVYNSTRPAQLDTSDDYKALCIKIPQRLLAVDAHTLDDSLVTTLSAEGGLAGIVWPLLTGLKENIELLGSAPRYTTVSGIANLIESMLLPDGPANPERSTHRWRNDLLIRIKDHLEMHLGDPDLSPQRVAKAHHISVRQLHLLFQADDVSISTWVRNRRIERCKADLANPTLATVPAAGIASKWGFRGASQFGQVFRATVGCTPLQFRAANLDRASAPSCVPDRGADHSGGRT